MEDLCGLLNVDDPCQRLLTAWLLIQLMATCVWITTRTQRTKCINGSVSIVFSVLQQCRNVVARLWPGLASPLIDQLIGYFQPTNR